LLDSVPRLDPASERARLAALTRSTEPATDLAAAD
jgi:hypothetical protein